MINRSNNMNLWNSGQRAKNCLALMGAQTLTINVMNNEVELCRRLHFIHVTIVFATETYTQQAGRLLK